MVSIFEERNVRIICSKNRSEIWFSAIDVGEELGIANIRDTPVSYTHLCPGCA